MAARKVNWSTVFFALVIVVAIAVLGYSAFQWLAGNTPYPAPSQDSPAAAASDFIVSDAAKPVPDDAFVDLQGGSHKLTDYKGKYVLVNFWATWCGPCKVELPSLERLQTKIGSDDFQVVTISIDKSADLAAKYLANKGLTGLDSFADPSLDLSTALGANEIPTTVLIDPASNMIGHHIGGAEWDGPAAVAALQKIIGAS
jgi:thiol-disulfide isomerase/thioredoxin